MFLWIVGVGIVIEKELYKALKKARSATAICFWEEKDITGNILILDLEDSGSFVTAKYNQSKVSKIVLILQLIVLFQKWEVKILYKMESSSAYEENEI